MKNPDGVSQLEFRDCHPIQKPQLGEVDVPVPEDRLIGAVQHHADPGIDHHKLFGGPDSPQPEVIEDVGWFEGW